MKAYKNIENPVSRTRLRRKVLERWENEGGKICTDPANTSQNRTHSERGEQTPPFSHDSTPEENDNASSLKKAS